MQDMAADHKSSVSTIDTLRNQLDSFAGRLGELERLKETQETTIQAKEEEKTVAHSQIKVSITFVLINGQLCRNCFASYFKEICYLANIYVC